MAATIARLYDSAQPTRSVLLATNKAKAVKLTSSPPPDSVLSRGSSRTRLNAIEIPEKSCAHFAVMLSCATGTFPSTFKYCDIKNLSRKTPRISLLIGSDSREKTVSGLIFLTLRKQQWCVLIMLGDHTRERMADAAPSVIESHKILLLACVLLPSPPKAQELFSSPATSKWFTKKFRTCWKVKPGENLCGKRPDSFWRARLSICAPWSKAVSVNSTSHQKLP